MKRVNLGILILAISICGLMAACEETPYTAVPETPNKVTTSILSSLIDSTAITTHAPISPTPIIFVKAPLTIDKSFDGREINVNLVKFTGSGSSGDTTVMVNNVQAIVNNDGSYYAYLDLKPGKNIIEIKTTINQISTSDTVTVTFIQPLIVNLEWPTTRVDDKSTITITGRVSDPLATVKVNNQQMNVGADGSFAYQMLLKEGKNSVSAVAIRGTDTDTSNLGLEVSNGGLNGPPPGFGSEYTSRLSFDNPILNLKAGATTALEFTFRADKDIPISGAKYNVTIKRLNSLETRNTLSDLPFLNVAITPSSFTIYPKIEYRSLVNIQTNSNIDPGNYYYGVNTNSGTFGSGFSFTLNINK